MVLHTSCEKRRAESSELSSAFLHPKGSNMYLLSKLFDTSSDKTYKKSAATGVIGEIFYCSLPKAFFIGNNAKLPVGGRVLTPKESLWWTLAAAVLLQAMVFYLIHKTGVAGPFIQWDECSYIYLGLVDVDRLKSLGFISGLSYLFDQNLAHEPITTLQILVAFLWFNNDLSAPYLFNVAYVFLFLYSINRALREFGSLPTIVFSLMAISVPLVFFFASHLKSDFLMGCLFFMMLVELFVLDAQTSDRLARACVIGCGVVLCKPTAFYMPGLLCFVFGIHFCREMVMGADERQWPRKLIPYLGVCSILVIVYAAIVIPYLPHFVAYIRENISPVGFWASHATLAERLRFYLPFANEEGQFGYWGPNFIALAILGLVFAANALLRKIDRKDSVSLLGLGAIAGAAYLPIVVSPQVQMAFGAPFGGAILAIFLLAYRALKRDMVRSHLVDWGLLALSLVCFHLPVRQNPQYLPLTKALTTKQASNVIDRFVGDITASGAPPNPKIYFSYSPIPDSDFGIEFHSKTGRFPASMFMSLAPDAETISNSVQTSDFVVAFDAGAATGPEDRWQKLSRSTAEVILAMSGLEEVDRMNFAQGSYRLYRVDRGAATR